MNFLEVNKILVIKLRQIGDVLLSVPVFRALREKFPQAHIAALVNSGTEEVLSGNTLIDEVIVFNRNIKKMNPLQKCLQEFFFIRNIRKQGFALTVDLTSGDRAAIISFLSGARYRLAHDPGRFGFWGKNHLYTHVAPKDGNQHIVLQNLDLVRQFDINTNNLTVDYYIPEEARLFVIKLFEDNKIREKDTVVHVHPTSRWLFKCWKDESMAAVISWLMEQGVKVIVTSAPDQKEIDRARKILSLAPPLPRPDPHLLDLCGQTNLKQLAAISAGADLFLGVDSAPMHIAAAVGTPVLALFGPSHVYRWAPWSNDASFPRTREDFAQHYKNGCYHLGNHVIVQRQWDCFPCGKAGCNGSKRSDCIEDISVIEVEELLNDMIVKKKR